MLAPEGPPASELATVAWSIPAACARDRERTTGKSDADVGDVGPEVRATDDERPDECRSAAEGEADEFATDEFDESYPAVSATEIVAVLVATAVPSPSATANAPTRPKNMAAHGTVFNQTTTPDGPVADHVRLRTTTGSLAIRRALDLSALLTGTP